MAYGRRERIDSPACRTMREDERHEYLPLSFGAIVATSSSRPGPRSGRRPRVLPQNRANWLSALRDGRGLESSAVQKTVSIMVVKLRLHFPGNYN